MNVKTHTHTQVSNGGQRLFVYLFSPSVASMTLACGGVVGFCVVNTLKIPLKYKRGA